MGKGNATGSQTARGRMRKSTAPAPKQTKGLYRPEFCQRLIEHMALGHSFLAFGGSVRVTRKTLYNWMEAHAEFKEAHEIAILACQNTLETIGLKGMIGGIRGFNPTPWIFMLKNICGWRDVQQHEHVGEIAVNTLQAAFAKVAAKASTVSEIEQATQAAYDAGNGKGNGSGLVH